MDTTLEERFSTAINIRVRYILQTHLGRAEKKVSDIESVLVRTFVIF